MTTIRRQSLISSAIVYLGFALGFFNTYLFTREGSGFSNAEYGLVNVFIALANLIYSLANLGMPSYIYKFHPYYKANLEDRENDMMSWALLVSLMGFLMIMAGGFIFKELVIRKYGTNAPGLIQYYQWIFPFGMGLTIYSVLEAYCWNLQKSVLTNYLREVQFRMFTTVLILLFGWGVIYNFDLFIKLYALTYLVLAGLLLVLLIKGHHLHFTLTISRVTRKFYKKVLALVGFIWSGSLFFTLSSVFDTLVIAAVLPNGLAIAGVYMLAQNMASLIQAPQRGIISSSVGVLSQAWKDKNLDLIGRIYHRSSINQIVFSAGMFVLIWINFTDGVQTFNLQRTYIDAKSIFLFIGLMRIVDMGTGLNSQIIGTSTFWRFDFFTGIILILITLPLNYLLTKSLGAIGPAIANLISISIYNFIRFLFLKRKFNLQPFTMHSLLTLCLALLGYGLCEFFFSGNSGLMGMILRSGVFLGVYLTGVISLKISPDILPVWHTLKNKLGFRK